MTTWFPIGLDGRSAINVMEGAYGATGGGTTADTTAISAAIAAMSTLGKKVLVLPSGYTFLTGALTFNVSNAHLVIMPGCTSKLVSSSANDTRLWTISGSDVTVWNFGTVDGNYDNQASATGQSAFYVTGDRVKIYGADRMGRVTGFRGNAIYYVDCDDGVVDGLRMDNILTRCIYGQLLTTGQTLNRFKVRNILADRTAQGASAGDGNIEIENQAGGSDVLVAPMVEDVESYLNDAAAAFHVEVYGGVVGGLTRPTIRNVYGDGGDSVLSVDHATGGVAENIRGTSQNDKGIEIAHCTGGFLLNGFWIDLESATTSSGVVVDNQNHSGNDLMVANGTILNPTTYGVLVKGNGSTQGKQVTVANVAARSSTASVVGFQAEYAPAVKFSNCRFFGSAATQEGLVLYDADGSIVDAFYAEFTAAATAGIRVELTTDFKIDANLIGGGTADDAINIIDAQRGTVNIRAKGFDGQLVGLVVNSGQTISDLDITAVGDGNSDVTLTNNSGTVSGDTIRLYVPAGWTPYGVLTGPKFLRFHTTTSSSNLLVEGIFTGDPNGSPVPYAGYAYYNGNLYTNKAGTWTAAN